MKIIEKYKMHKLEKVPIRIVLNSNFDYKDHDLNILKACLNAWTKEDAKYIPLKFDWIFVDPEQKEKMFFISTNLKELKQFKLEKIAENNDILSTAYMNSAFTSAIFSVYDIMGSKAAA